MTPAEELYEQITGAVKALGCMRCALNADDITVEDICDLPPEISSMRCWFHSLSPTKPQPKRGA